MEIAALYADLGDKEPFGPFGVSVLGVNVLLRVLQSLVDTFQTVRFLADAFDLVDLDVPSV